MVAWLGHWTWHGAIEIIFRKNLPEEASVNLVIFSLRGLPETPEPIL